jgi:hypothetical protein
METENKNWFVRHKILTGFGALIIFFLLIGIMSRTSPPPTESNSVPKTTEKSFKFENYIQQDKVREFKITEEENASIKALGDKKPSEYSSEELRNLPTNYRIRYSVIVPADITLDELKSTLAQVIKEKSTENSDIDEIWVGAWESEESMQGNPVIGNAKWCLNGKPGSVTPEIAINNIRENYSIVYDILEDIIGNIQENKNTNLSELAEEIKKEIHRKLAECEGESDIEAKKYYSSSCEQCPEFIEDNLNKYVKKMDELLEACIEKVRSEYNITEETELKISAEALLKRWSIPPYPPNPSCCK